MASRDITYCSNTECQVKTCWRNQNNIISDIVAYMRIAELKGLECCLDFARGGGER